MRTIDAWWPKAFATPTRNSSGLGYEVFGVSSQSPDDHALLPRVPDFLISLLSNANFAFADALGLPRFETGWRLLPQTADDARAQRHHLSRHLPA